MVWVNCYHKFVYVGKVCTISTTLVITIYVVYNVSGRIPSPQKKRVLVTYTGCGMYIHSGDVYSTVAEIHLSRLYL